MTAHRMIFAALGGAGEIGMNMYLYGYGPRDKERFILVDIGVCFPSEALPGVNLIMADPQYVIDRIERLDGIFITHAHEDHIGALGFLYPYLATKVYCRQFTASVARAKLHQQGQNTKAVISVAAYPEVIDCGAIRVSFLPISHSIPEASALLIETPAGRIIHSGDFKLDINPGMGDVFDAEYFATIGRLGIHALVCDSTNVFVQHRGGSESSLLKPFTTLFAKQKGAIIVTTFASNLARLQTIAKAAAAVGRSIAVMGRSMHNMLTHAGQCKLLHDFPPIINERKMHRLARNRLLVLVTGSQGERRAVSGQLSNGVYKGFALHAGDLFLFSSKTIPGNERAVARVVNDLVRQDVQVIDEDSEHYHISGHANRPDLQKFHALIQPKILIPMHGEYRHLQHHANIAKAKGMANIVADNGVIVDLSKDTPKIVGYIKPKKLYLDGDYLIDAFDGTVLNRIHMAHQGMVCVSLVIRATNILSIRVATCGLPIINGDLSQILQFDIDKNLQLVKKNLLRDDRLLEKKIKKIVTKLCRIKVGKNSLIKVLINRLSN